MKEKLSSQDDKVVSIFDEATLWSAPFASLLLENIPMKPKATVLDIGFGTGLPLVELAQRFGDDSTIYGIDIWSQGIKKAQEKIEVLGLDNIEIFEQSASEIPLDSNSVDLITSNLGVNNFNEKEKVIHECYRVLKKEGVISISTNPIGTFKEIFTLFEIVFKKMGLSQSSNALENYINRRGTKESIIDLFESNDFECIKNKDGHSSMRFTNAKAVLDHRLIRIGFIEGWESLVPKEHKNAFFTELENQIQQVINHSDEFSMSIPMLYLEFVKE